MLFRDEMAVEVEDAERTVENLSVPEDLSQELLLSRSYCICFQTRLSGPARVTICIVIMPGANLKAN